jgi:hypothetical protein
MTIFPQQVGLVHFVALLVMNGLLVGKAEKPNVLEMKN